VAGATDGTTEEPDGRLTDGSRSGAEESSSWATPGWYADPWGEAPYRFFNGASWTKRTCRSPWPRTKRPQLALALAALCLVAVAVATLHWIGGLPSGNSFNTCAYVSRDQHDTVAVSIPEGILALTGMVLGVVFARRGAVGRNFGASAAVLCLCSLFVVCATLFVGGMSGLCSF